MKDFMSRIMGNKLYQIVEETGKKTSPHIINRYKSIINTINRYCNVKLDVRHDRMNNLRGKQITIKCH